MNRYLKLNKYIVKNRRSHYILLLLTLVDAFLKVITTLSPIWFINTIIEKDLNKFIFVSSSIFVLFMVMIVNSYFLGIYKESVIEKMMVEIKNIVYSKAINQNAEKVNNVDEYISWGLNDIEIIKGNYLGKLYDLYTSVFTFIIMLIILVRINLVLLLILLLISALNLMFMYKASQIIQNATVKFSQLKQEYISRISNLLKGYSIFYFYNKESKYRNILNDKFNGYIDIKIDYIKSEVIYNSLMLILDLVSRTILLLGSSLLYIANLLSFGVGFSVLQIFSMLLGIVGQFSDSIGLINASFAIFEKFDNIVLDNRKKEIKNIEKIEYKDINVIYEDKKVLNNFNLTIEKGKKYLIIGESGSGKSTIVNLLLGLNSNYTGDILINDIDVKEVSKDSIFNNISYVNSDNYIFKSNILENISLYEDKDVSSLIKEFRLEEIDKEQELSDSNISTGQKQRINLARAILFNRGYIILDEATANLDIENRRYIEDRLLLDKEKTIIMITHHLDDELKSKFDKIIEKK